jgi:hypothetical protein
MSFDPVLGHELACAPNRAQNPVVGTAAAKVKVQRRAYLRIGRGWVPVEQSDRAHDNSTQAVAALACLFVDKRLL